MRTPALVAVLALVTWPALSFPQSPEPPAEESSAAAEAAPEPGPEEETPAFQSEVELVTVDVVVVDKNGRAVPGFTKADFSIEEEGDPQAIIRFEAVELPSLPPLDEEAEATPLPPVSSNRGEETRQYRTFVIIFDDINLSPAQALRAKAAIGEFLRTGTRDGDLVVLVASAGSAWWTARIPEGTDELVDVLKRLDGRYVYETSPDRVTPYEAMRIIEYDDPDTAYVVTRRFDTYAAVNREREDSHLYADSLKTTALVGLIDPYVRSRAADVHRQSIQRRRVTMRTMARAIEALQGVRGRKAMILVSQGFIFQQGFKPMRELVEASLRVNVPIHFIDTRGLVALPEFMTATYASGFDTQDTMAVLADITRDAEGSEAVALDTGGIVVRNTNDLTSGIKRVSDESQAFYLLGYYPTHTERNGKFREIDVKLNGDRGKGLKVRARRGYYAPLEGETRRVRSEDSDPAILHALDSPYDIRDVPLRVTTLSFDETLTQQLSVLLAAEIDVKDLELTESEGRIRGDVAFLVETQHLQSGEYYNIDEKIEMAMLPETYERLKKTGYVVSRELTLPPGDYQAKVVVKDLASGKIGTVIHDFDVPEPTGLRLSTPLLSNALEDQAPGSTEPPRPVLRVRRQFEPGSILYVQYSVMGAEKDDQSFLPRVMAGYEIRRADGSVFKRADPTLINPTSIGSLLRLHGINLLGAEPGDYDLVLHVKDSLAGKDLEVHEAFSIGDDGPAAGTRTSEAR
jgi:VWFA-related protein